MYISEVLKNLAADILLLIVLYFCVYTGKNCVLLISCMLYIPVCAHMWAYRSLIGVCMSVLACTKTFVLECLNFSTDT